MLLELVALSLASIIFATATAHFDLKIVIYSTTLVRYRQN